MEKEKTELDRSDAVQMYKMETEAKHEASNEMKKSSFLHSYQVTTMEQQNSFREQRAGHEESIHRFIHQNSKLFLCGTNQSLLVSAFQFLMKISASTIVNATLVLCRRVSVSLRSQSKS